ELALFVAHRADHHARPERRAVLAHAPALLREAAFARRDLELPLRLAVRDLLGRVEAREMLADDLGRGVALDALGTGVPARDAAVRIEHEDRVVDDALHHQAEASLALREERGALAHARLELVARVLELREHCAERE